MKEKTTFLLQIYLFCIVLWAITLGIYLFDNKETAEPGEPFSEEQIKMLQDEVVFPEITEEDPIVMKGKKEDYSHIEPIKEPTYIYLEEIPMSQFEQEFCQGMCRKYKVSYSLFLAMIESESTFGQFTEGGGAIGPMQIHPVNASKYEELDVYDRLDNIEIGIRMMGELMEKYQSADKVIMAYKGGESAMLEWVEQGIRLECCDVLEGKAIYYEQRIMEERTKQDEVLGD